MSERDESPWRLLVPAAVFGYPIDIGEWSESGDVRISVALRVTTVRGTPLVRPVYVGIDIERRDLDVPATARALRVGNKIGTALAQFVIAFGDAEGVPLPPTPADMIRTVRQAPPPPTPESTQVTLYEGTAPPKKTAPK